MAQSAPAPKPAPAKEKTAAAALSFFKEEFPLIRKAAILFGVSLLLSAVLVGISQVVLQDTQEGMNREQAQRNEAYSKQHQAEVDKTEVLNYQPKYLQLQKQGFVGEEKRLDWIEQIKSIRDNRKLLPVAYEISAQQPIQIDAAEFPTGDLELRASRMRLRMGLLHEMDLLNFLADLKGRGFYTVRSCKLTREAVEATPMAPRLSAECELLWLTLGERIPAPEQPGAAPQ